MASSDDSCDTSSLPAEDQTEATAPLSAVTVAENIDLLTSILSRSDAKPLMRFKSVSKQWLTLICSPRFRHLHTLQNPNPKPSSLFFPPHVRKDGIEYEFVPLDDPNSTLRSPPFGSLRLDPDLPCFYVSSSCNGLLLCSPWNKKAKSAYIFNPTTKHLSVLTPPAAAAGSLSASSTRYSLAFDPPRSPHYKVVMARSAPGTNAIGGKVTIWAAGPGSEMISSKEMFEIHVYSSETRSWKKHEREIEWRSFYMFDEGIYLNGAMHWAGKKEGFMCFDIDRNSLRPMPEPPGFRGWDESVIRYFGESGGSLHLVDIQGYEVMEIDVYVLERDYSKWSQKYRIDMNRFSGSYPTMISSAENVLAMDYYNFSVLSLLQGGEDGDDEQLILHVTGKVISYSFKSKSIKELRHLLPGKVYHRPAYMLRSFDGYLYWETLACA